MSLKLITTNNKMSKKFTGFENLFLAQFQQFFPKYSSIPVSTHNGIFEIIIESKKTKNYISIWIENDEIGIGIGKWTHTHFTEIDESLLFIQDIVNDNIVAWKVTKPDGCWYSGHYDIRLWQENVDRKDWNYHLIDEPDSQLEPNCTIHRSTFNKILE